LEVNGVEALKKFAKNGISIQIDYCQVNRWARTEKYLGESSQNAFAGIRKGGVGGGSQSRRIEGNPNSRHPL
jgi:hypothetical protein